MRVCIENIDEDLAQEVCDEVIKVLEDKLGLEVDTVSKVLHILDGHTGYEIVLESE